MLLLDNVVLEINPNKHAAIIKTITLIHLKQCISIQQRADPCLCQTEQRGHSLTSALPYIYYNDITRKICRYNEKRSRYYEKRSRYNEKRSHYYDIIEWKNIIWMAVLRHRKIQTKPKKPLQNKTATMRKERPNTLVQFATESLLWLSQ